MTCEVNMCVDRVIYAQSSPLGQRSSRDQTCVTIHLKAEPRPADDTARAANISPILDHRVGRHGSCEYIEMLLHLHNNNNVHLIPVAHSPMYGLIASRKH